MSPADNMPVPRMVAPVVYPSKVLISLPWQKQVCPVTAFCVAQLTDRNRTASALHYGDAFVAHSRNACVNLLLGSKLEWMLTIDDDMVVPFGHADWFRANTGFRFPEKFMAFNAIDRLMSHQKSLVGALYFGRAVTAPPVYNEGGDPAEAKYARSGPHDVCKPTRWVGTGCMLTHRSVFEDIEKKFPQIARGQDGKGGHWFSSGEVSLRGQIRQLKDELSNGPLTGDKAYLALQRLEGMEQLAGSENSLGIGEDVSLCHRAAAAGHQPYVDMGLVCGHIGYTVFGPHNTGLS